MAKDQRSKINGLMESKGFKNVSVYSNDHEETFVDNNTGIVFKNDHSVAIADYENWRFMVLSTDMIKLLYNACEAKGWLNDESNI